MMSGRSNPFTAAQWQELELQALFFKFMVSGHPIPPDLILSINGKNPIFNNIQPQNIGIGWSGFELGLSCRKTDPEPTRCRRTDGKKWRCSRKTSGDSKYCERHLHRGKSRLRKSSESNSTPLQLQSIAQSAAPLSSMTTSTCDMKPVEVVNFMTILGINQKVESQEEVLSNDNVAKRSEKKQKMFHQFLEDSSHEKRDSWLSLVI